MGKILSCLVITCLAVVWSGLARDRVFVETQDQINAQTGVSYTFLSQRWLTEEELKQFKDAHGLTLTVRMRFSNHGKNPVYFLAKSAGSLIPEGYRSFRKVGDTKWQYLPQSRGREGAPGSEFTGVAYTWLQLPAGASIEFETFDWSRDDEEHALSAFVKTDMDSKPVEVISNIFRPLSKEKETQ